MINFPFQLVNWQCMNLKLIHWIHPIVLTKNDEGGCKSVHKTNQHRRALFSHLLSLSSLLFELGVQKKKKNFLPVIKQFNVET